MTNDVGSLRLRTHAVKLTQVISNLLSNAGKYHHNPQKGSIVIGAIDHHNHVEVFVKDDGPGIDRKFHDKIFEMFQTLNPKDEYDSTGIGLGVVKKIVQNRGGSIWVDSEVGLGAKFSFSWPKELSK